MIYNSLYNIPKIVLLRSDKILHKLLRSLTSGHSSLDDNFDELLSGVRDFYPNSYRLDEIELSLAQEDILHSGISSDYNHKNFHGLDYDYTFMQEIFDEFFIKDGGTLYVKDERVNDYMEFISKVSPFQLMGYGLSNKLLKNEIKIETLIATVSNYTPLGLRVEKHEPYAENHLHLKGSGYLAFNFSKIISNPTPKEYYRDDFLKEIPRINEFSYINNHQISIGQLVDLLKLCKDIIYDSVLSGYENEELMSESRIQRIQQKKKEAIGNLQKIIFINGSVTPRNNYNIEILSKINQIVPLRKRSVATQMVGQIIQYYDQYEYSKSYFLESILFFYIYNIQKDNFFKRIIKIYLHTINILRSYMVMSQNLGLAHFGEYSSSAIREVEKRNAHNTAKSIINSGTSKLNAKMGTLKTSEMIAQRVINLSRAFKYKERSIDVNFGLSITKGREEDGYGERYLLPRFYHKRMGIKEETFAIDNFVRNVQYKSVERYMIELHGNQIKAFQNRAKWKDKSVDISSLVVAVDAVGKETHTPPEVFAPHFRYLRNLPEDMKCDIFLGSHRFQPHKRLIMCVHAGEDFNHLITGIRRVDEAIEYFGLERRDRLGHLLSLGLTPKVWIENIREIVVYKGDYFDDLVWMVQRLKYIPNKKIDTQWYINLCEDTIWRLFGELYPEFGERRLAVVELYNAWLYRRNCPIVYQQRERGELIYGEYDKRVLDAKEPTKNVKKLYELYNTSKKTRDAYAQVYRVNKSDITDDILDIWEALQDYMLNEIAKKGIIAETNPSSNIFISSLRSYKYHPIFRFSPPKEEFLRDGGLFNRFGLRDGKVATTINSDDPSIFVTTLQNEHRLIKNCAKNHYQCSDKEADDWIKDIRMFGVKVFDELYETQ